MNIVRRYLSAWRAYLRAWIYRTLIVNMTSKWYYAVLSRIDRNSKILDVGIGDGEALVKNVEIVTSKSISIHGIDIDTDYLEYCKQNIVKYGLENLVDVAQESIYDHKGKYDHVYFSGSFMILPNPKAVLLHTRSLLSNGDGKVFFTQSLETRRSRFMEILKPLLKYIVTIDFGNVTYEDDFLSLLSECGYDIEEHVAIQKGSIASAAKLTVAIPRLFPQ